MTQRGNRCQSPRIRGMGVPDTRHLSGFAGDTLPDPFLLDAHVTLAIERNGTVFINANRRRSAWSENPRVYPVSGALKAQEGIAIRVLKTKPMAVSPQA